MKYLCIDSDGEASQLETIDNEYLQLVLDGDVAIYKLVSNQYWWLEVEEAGSEDVPSAEFLRTWHEV